MKILAFDTSNATASVAISIDQKIVAYNEEIRPNMQAERLIYMIEQSLNDANFTYNDIDYLGVISGPGSFTGIRIGLATAKAITMSTRILCSTVTNFDIALFRAQMQISNHDNPVFAIILNAMRNQLYFQIFKDNTESKCCILDQNAVYNILKDYKNRVVCAGSGINAIYQQIKHLKHLKIIPRFQRIKAIHICRHLNNLMSAGKAIRPIAPLYIRPVDAIVSIK